MTGIHATYVTNLGSQPGKTQEFHTKITCHLNAPKEGVSGSEIAARNRKSLAAFHRTLKSQCSIAFSMSLEFTMGISQSQKIAAISACTHGAKFCTPPPSTPENYLLGTKNPPLWVPQKHVYVPHFLGKDTTRDPHKHFQGDFGSKRGPKRTI